MPPDEDSRTPKPVDQNVKSDTRPARRASPPGGGSRPPGGRKEDWIAQHLRRVYDDALSEDIPQEMLDLLKSLDDSDPTEGKPG